MTMTETDRNKMPVAVKRESMTRDFPERFFFITLFVCIWCDSSSGGPAGHLMIAR